ncbi:MAG: hypothetical protein IJ939_06375 [Clostridia bacterium]|nr:hypothetical protein [Clostridia bacterium]
MNSVIYNPLEDYENKFKSLHAKKTNSFFEKLVKQSGVDIEKNRETVKLYNEYRENLRKLKRKLNWLRFFRVLMIITVLLIPLVILKTTPKIKRLRTDIEEADKKADELLREANNQMLPLNSLFTDRDALHLIEETVPLISFDEHFSVRQEMDMKTNYDFCEQNENEQSTLDTLAGNYNENPFLFENKLIHTMGTETYHGYKTIHWTESYIDSNGKHRTRTRSQTLHATVTKQKPYYSTQVVLNYCSQGGPELEFSRDASHLEQKSEKQIERYVERGERRLKRKTDKALRENDDFVSMSNSDFEVLFDALDRTDEVQFRTLFTPLAQTNMVSLILSRTGYGDDFNFFKRRRTNRIISNHSQGRAIKLVPGDYASYSFDEIKNNFTVKNEEFFKAVYFDFAPVLAIPVYQERPVHSLKPLPDYSRLYSFKECEALANAVDYNHLVHPNTKTQAILKSTYVGSDGEADETCITAYSYDIEKRVDIVSVYGGDGRFHNVPVEWDDYLPLEASNNLFVASGEVSQNKNVLARRNGLCIYNN